MSEKTNVISMVEATKDGTKWSVQDALADALKDAGNPETRMGQVSKVIVIGLVDVPEGEYDLAYVQAGMKASEIVALLNVAKVYFLHEMGY